MFERAMLALFEGKAIMKAEMRWTGKGAKLVLSFSDTSKAEIDVETPADVLHIAPNRGPDTEQILFTVGRCVP
jgi:hypothetical protein